MAEILDFSKKKNNMNKETTESVHTYKIVTRKYDPQAGQFIYTTHVVKGSAIGMTPTFLAVADGEAGANFVIPMESLDYCERIDDKVVIVPKEVEVSDNSQSE